jgi:serine/threonine protein kinase
MPDLKKLSAENDDDTLVQEAPEIERALGLSRQREEPPALVPGYTILSNLGEGSYGSVWLAREENTGKKVAIKFYTHRRGIDWSLLNREVEKLAVLYTSRNIVGLLDVGWDSDPPYYVMEYLENGSLDSILSGGALPAHEAVRITQSVLQALVHAHGSGILHCDLKPANILLDSDFEPRLCDFGQSRLSDEQDPALGTLFYMAPEQADLKAVPDARWDVYALGALMYHMLCGKAPFRTPENEQRIHSTETLKDRLAVYRRILKQSPQPDLHRKMTGVDKRLADIVDRCLQIDPQKRYPNAQVVLDMLDLRDRQRSRRPLLALGVVGPVLLLGAMAFFFTNATQSAVQTTRDKLFERALESNALTAKIMSRSLQRDLEDRRSELIQIVQQAELPQAVENAAGKPWPERATPVAFMNRLKVASDELRKDLNRSEETSWFVTNRNGLQIWRHPKRETIGRTYKHRDYFHGQGQDYKREDVKDKEIKPIEQPHISVAFRSEATGLFMVAISVPIRDSNNNVIGILARTTHMGKLLDDYRLGIAGGDEVDRSVALVGHGDWKLLDHPWMTQQKLQNMQDEKFKKLTIGENLQQKLARLQERIRRDEPPAGDDRDDNYDDPVGQTGFDPSNFGGKWLAAFAPVGDTGWTVIVQEKKEEAHKPVDEMQAGMLELGLWALAVSFALIGLMLYFVLRALNDPSLRMWRTANGSSRLIGSLTATLDRSSETNGGSTH